MEAADTPRAWPAFVRQVIEYALRGTDAGRASAPPSCVEPHGGAFVTIRKLGRLRGCMGTLDADTPIAEAVRQAAISAALHDQRFPPVAIRELTGLTVEVSIMSPPWLMNDVSELVLGQHGVIVTRGRRQGLFLPQVATEHRFDKETFLSRCCSEKAGLPAEAWRDADTEVSLFTVDIFSETPNEATS